MGDKNKIIDLRTTAKPVRIRDQKEIIAERRKKRREMIEEVKRKNRQ
jgi:hypothetical protein